MADRASFRCAHPRRAVSRTGLTLVELLVALPLTTLVAALAAILLLNAAREGRRDEARRITRRELRHARQALAADLAPVTGTRLHRWTDSLIEFSATLGDVVLCATVDSTLFVSAAPGDTPPSFIDALRDGDEVHAWTDTLIGAPPQAHVATVRGPGAAAGIGACPTGSGTASRWRVPLHGAAPALTVGFPVSLRRDVQWLHYRSGTSWWLGRRARDGGSWETTQPVAGPLLSVAAAGMRVQALASNGSATAIADSVALLRVVLRMPRRLATRSGVANDSADLWLPLRAASGTGAPP